MTEVKRGTGVAMFVVLVVAIGGLGYGVAGAAERLDHERGEARTPAIASPQPGPGPAPEQVPPPVDPTPTPDPEPAPTPSPTPPPAAAGEARFQVGDHGPAVRRIQARLKQLEWYFGDVTDDYGASTAEAVRGFQAKRELPVTGAVDDATLARLVAMTHAPTSAELLNKPTDGSWTDAPLDPRCLEGRALCVDKSSRTVRWMVDGKLVKTMAVRFGAAYTPTREGLFTVQSKSRDHVSSLYDTPMPFAMFFSRGQAVHYSPDFAATGYNGASHGCVNVRDYAGIRWLFDQVRVGDKVVVYWS